MFINGIFRREKAASLHGLACTRTTTPLGTGATGTGAAAELELKRAEPATLEGTRLDAARWRCVAVRGFRKPMDVGELRTMRVLDGEH